MNMNKVDKLDQSLDTIVTERRKTNRRLRPRRAPGAGKPSTTAPIGGIKKATKQAKQPEKGGPAKRPQATESKINVSNLVSS
jgi:THO complex subunit 4